jgi:NAD(P)H-hydrate epimerase
MTAGFPIVRAEDIGWLTEGQMIEVDRVMIEDLQIELIQMMENAGRNLAQLIVDQFSPRTATVLAGSGGNGGGGLVAARHLANRGVDVTVTTTRPAGELSPVPAHQLDILRRMGVPTTPDLGEADVVIDALIGYSLRGAPSGRSAALIDAVNAHPATVVSLDTPSGLDVNNGATPGAVVRADATLTLVLPKIGMRNSDLVGALYLADISVPRPVTAAYGSPAPDFRQGSVLRIE